MRGRNGRTMLAAVGIALVLAFVTARVSAEDKEGKEDKETKEKETKEALKEKDLEQSQGPGVATGPWPGAGGPSATPPRWPEASGRAFIQPQERPDLSGQALREADGR